VISALAVIIALLCAAASTRRLWFAANATGIHPEESLAAVKKGGIEAFRAAAEKEPRADWERDLIAALSTEDEKARVALVNEQLTELDYRIQRWARVPRVCASVTASFAFLLATLVLRQGISEDLDIISTDINDLVTTGLVGQALTVAAMGLVGTAFCIAAAGEARKIASARAKAADKLVEALEKAVLYPKSSDSIREPGNFSRPDAV
jgi:hypothetical protein